MASDDLMNICDSITLMHFTTACTRDGITRLDMRILHCIAWKWTETGIPKRSYVRGKRLFCSCQGISSARNQTFVIKPAISLDNLFNIPVILFDLLRKFLDPSLNKRKVFCHSKTTFSPVLLPTSPQLHRLPSFSRTR
jgi:hypothetical protein